MKGEYGSTETFLIDFSMHRQGLEDLKIATLVWQRLSNSWWPLVCFWLPVTGLRMTTKWPLISGCVIACSVMAQKEEEDPLIAMGKISWIVLIQEHCIFCAKFPEAAAREVKTGFCQRNLGQSNQQRRHRVANQWAGRRGRFHSNHYKTTFDHPNSKFASCPQL